MSCSSICGNVDRFQQFVEADLPTDGHAVVPRSGPTCRDVEAVVAGLFGLSPDALRRPTPGTANDARSLAIALCVELRAATTAHLAQRFGLTSQASVRTIARRGRVHCAADPAFAAMRREAMARLGWYLRPETIGA